MKKRTGKVFLWIATGIAAFILILVCVAIVYKQDIKYFLTKDVDGYALVNFKTYSTNKNVQDLVREFAGIYGSGLESAVAEGNRYTKYLKNIFVIHYNEGEIVAKPIDKYNLVFGIDIGALYYPAATQINTVFIKKGNFYVLKPQYQKMIESSPETKNLKIYMRPYRGIFLVSLSEKVLYDYIIQLKKGPRNTKLIKTYDTLKNQIIFAGIDLNSLFQKLVPENIFIKKLNTATINFKYNYTLQRVVGEVNIDAEGELFRMLDASKVPDRPLMNYIGRDMYYLSNNNFSEFLRFVSEGFKKFNDTDYLAAINSFMGFDILEIVKPLGNEMIIGNENDNFFGAVALKNKQQLEKYLIQFNGNYAPDKYMVFNNNISIKDGSVFLNREWEKYNNDIYLTRETFFYYNMNLGKTFNIPELGTIYTEIEGRYSPEYNLDFYLTMQKEDIKTFMMAAK